MTTNLIKNILANILCMIIIRAKKEVDMEKIRHEIICQNILQGGLHPFGFGCKIFQIAREIRLQWKQIVDRLCRTIPKLIFIYEPK